MQLFLSFFWVVESANADLPRFWCRTNQKSTTVYQPAPTRKMPVSHSKNEVLHLIYPSPAASALVSCFPQYLIRISAPIRTARRRSFLKGRAKGEKKQRPLWCVAAFMSAGAFKGCRACLFLAGRRHFMHAACLLRLTLIRNFLPPISLTLSDSSYA